jgi:type II secretory pathway component PulF
MDANTKRTLYRQLGTLLASGFNISGALQHLSKNSTSDVSYTASKLYSGITKGNTLTRQMRLLSPDIFTEFEIGVIEAGENSGSLTESLASLAEYFEFMTGIKNKMLSGLTYPVILLHLAILIPAVPALFLQGIGAFLIKVFPPLFLIYLLFFSVIFFFRHSKNSTELTEKKDNLILKMPFFGKLFMKIEVIRFLRAFVALYTAGAGIVRGVEIAAETVGNTIIKNDIKTVLPLLRKGSMLSEVFCGKRWFPVVVCDMLRTGEVSGTIEETLKRVSDYLKDEVNVTVEQILKVLPVVVYLLVALYIGYIVISFYARYIGMLTSFY